MEISYTCSPLSLPKNFQPKRGGIIVHRDPSYLHRDKSFLEKRDRLQLTSVQWKKKSRSTLSIITLAAPDCTAVITDMEQGHTIPGVQAAISNLSNSLVLADLDPATAKLLIGISGPILSGFGFLFIARIVMSWYPKLPVDKFPYVIAYAPTEPLLYATRKVIPPVGGVDITPVVWFAFLSFFNEILLGPQGLLVLLSQQVQ